MKTYIFVINGLGIGALPDYSKYQTNYTNTFESIGVDFGLPTLEVLGFYNIFGVGNEPIESPIGVHGRMRMLSDKVGFEWGIREILGNVCTGEGANINRENLLDILNNKGFKVTVIASNTTLQGAKSFVDCTDMCRSIGRGEISRADVVFAVCNDFAVAVAEKNTAKIKSFFVNFDKYIGKLLGEMQCGDMLIIVGNQGIDSEGNITREYSPLIAYIPPSDEGTDLGTVQGLDSVAMTVVHRLGIYRNDKTLIKDKVITESSVEYKVIDIKQKISDRATKYKKIGANIVRKIDIKNQN